MNTAIIGREGERIASSYLEQNGYKVVKRNFKAYGAEIDLVAVKEKTTVFTEVKYWNTFEFHEMERALNQDKRRRIVRASKGFLSRYPVFSENRIRFDLLYLSGAGVHVKHVKDIFSETEPI